MTAVFLLQGGARGLAVCLCGDGAIEVTAVEAVSCCDETSGPGQNGSTYTQHGKRCTDCIDIQLFVYNEQNVVSRTAAKHVPAPLMLAESIGPLAFHATAAPSWCRPPDTVYGSLPIARAVVLRV